MTKIATTLGAVLVPGIAAAHPEHFSGGAFSIVHYLTDPFHVGPTCAAILLFVAASRSVRRRHSMNRKAQ